MIAAASSLFLEASPARYASSLLRIARKVSFFLNHRPACTVRHLYLRYAAKSVHLCLRQGAGMTGWRRQAHMSGATIGSSLAPKGAVDGQFVK
ncbi:MAG: hypothetical protein ABSA23_13820 [Anaerolineales bacterium]